MRTKKEERVLWYRPCCTGHYHVLII